MKSRTCTKGYLNGIKQEKTGNKMMNTLKKAAIGAGIALTTMFAANKDAEAQILASNSNAPATSSLTNSMTKAANPEKTNPTYSVSVKDVSEYESRTAQTVAGRSSANAIVVLYLGSNKELQRQVLEGASKAKDEGIYVRGMLIGVADPRILDGKDNFMIYVDGMPVTKPGDVQDIDGEFNQFNSKKVTLSNLVHSLIVDANRDDLQPALQRRQAQASVAVPNSPQ